MKYTSIHLAYIYNNCADIRAKIGQWVISPDPWPMWPSEFDDRSTHRPMTHTAHHPFQPCCLCLTTVMISEVDGWYHYSFPLEIRYSYTLINILSLRNGSMYYRVKCIIMRRIIWPHDMVFKLSLKIPTEIGSHFCW